MRRPGATTKSSSHSPQLEKAQVQHQRPSIAKKENKKKPLQPLKKKKIGQMGTKIHQTATETATNIKTKIRVGPVGPGQKPRCC